MSRPLHFFGGFGLLGMIGGSIMAVVLLGMKMLNPAMDVMHQHGPMFVIGSVLIVSGIQLLAIGLLGELQVRHYYTSQHPASYTVDRLVRLASRRRAEPALREQGRQLLRAGNKGPRELKASRSPSGGLLLSSSLGPLSPSVPALFPCPTRPLRFILTLT